MTHELKISFEFDEWLKGLSNTNTNRVLSRLYRVEQGNFGDHKRLDGQIYYINFTAQQH